MDLKVSEILTTQFNEVPLSKEKKIDDNFTFTLNKLEDDGMVERLTSKIAEITEVGKTIAEHMDIKDLRKYRTLITEFINDVVTNSHKFSRENFLDRRGRHRVYGIVKLVNKSLDELAQELLKKEKDHIAILDKTGEIQGLLLDILL